MWIAASFWEGLHRLARRAWWRGADPADATAARGAAYARDPLSHPAIRRMSEREKADLPFDPSRFSP